MLHDVSDEKYFDEKFKMNDIKKSLPFMEVNSDAVNLSDCQNSVVEYIACYVNKKLRQILNCQACIKQTQSNQKSSDFISMKSKVFLTYPSQDMLTIEKDVRKKSK